MVDSITKAYLSIGIKQELIQEEVIQLDEELNDTEKAMAARMKGTGHSFYRGVWLKQHPKAEDAFKNHPDTTQWSHRIPVDMATTNTQPHFGVMSFLKDKGYSVTHDDYKAGIAKKSTIVGDPERGIPFRDKITEEKIGGLLSKHKAGNELEQAYTNDPFRTNAKVEGWDLIIRGDPEGILQGATGHKAIMPSCSNVRTTDERDKFKGKGPASKCLPEEISGHTHHVFAVKRGGSVEHDAIARTSYANYTDLITGKSTLFPKNRVYGNAPDWFLPKSNEIMRNLFKNDTNAMYKIQPGIYPDGAPSYIFPENPTGEHLDLAWKDIASNKDGYERAKVIGMINPDHKYKSKTLRDTVSYLKDIQSANKTGDFVKIADSIMSADRGMDHKVQLHMSMKNPHMESLLDHAASQFNMDRPDHVKKMADLSISKNSGSGNFKQDFMGKVSRNLPEAKTLDQYASLSKLKQSGMYVGGTIGIKIHSEHKLGRYPFEAIIKHHAEQGTLNPESYQLAYSSTYNTNRKKGNLYDSAVRHEREGIPGMSAIVDHWANRLNQSATSDWGTTYHESLAKSFYNMLPGTRERIASAIGVDHKEVMKLGKAGIDKQKAQDKLLGR